MDKNIKGVSILESLVCIVIIGIGFIAMLQLSSYSINAMDRSLEKNKLNFLSEMVLEDIIADPDNATDYGNFNQSSCTYSYSNGSKLYQKKIDKWKKIIEEKSFLRIDNIDRKPPCDANDYKKTIIGNGTGKVNFLTGKGKRKKYLGVVFK